MDQNRFDDLTRTLATSVSRRDVLRRLGAGVIGAAVATLLPRRATAAADDCAAFCQQLEGRARGQCISDAAQGTGLCYQCGPLAPAGSGMQLCGGACVDTSSDPNRCGSCTTVCPTGATCANGACVCPPFTVLCQSTGTCVSDFCNVRKVFNPTTCQCECDAPYVTLPAGGCAIPCITNADCPGGRCDTTTEGQQVCNCGTLVHCTNCTTSFDCSNGCSAINVYCNANDQSCGVVC